MNLMEIFPLTIGLQVSMAIRSRHDYGLYAALWPKSE